MKKIFFLAVFLLFFVSFANALSLRTHLVEVQITDSGFAEVFERYELKFDTTFEASDFRKAVSSNSSSLLAWEADYNFFFPRFGSAVGNIVERSFVTFEEERRTIVLNYVLANRFASIKSEEPLQIKWAIPGRNLGSFESAGLIAVPENTSIKFVLPDPQSINVEPKASVKVEDNVVFVSGISTSFFNLEYTLFKPISSTINFSQSVSDFFSSAPNVLLLAAVFAALIAGYLKRKTIYQKLEDYIVSHSKIEFSPPEEETVLED